MESWSGWSDQTEGLGEQLGEWILRQVSLPESVQSLLAQEYFGNSLFAYGFLALAIVLGWGLGLIVSIIAGQGLRIVLGRFSQKLGRGTARAVAGPLRLSVLCWVALLGTGFLARPPEPPPMEVPATSVESEVSTPVDAAEPTPMQTEAAMPELEDAAAAASAPADEPASGLTVLLRGLLQSWQPHYTYLILRGFFSFVVVLSLFWIAARLMRFFWRDYLEPWIESSVEGAEKLYFPVIYRTLVLLLWGWALLSSIAAVGYDSRDGVLSVLRYEAANNTIAQYLSFLGLVVLTLLLARSVFTLVSHQVAKVVAKHGGEKEASIEETWFSGLQQPTVLLITLLGFRLAAELLDPNPGELLNIYGIVTTAIHVCLTANVVWIAFKLIDKFFAYLLYPLANASGSMDIQLVYLGRKTAKIGMGLIGFIFMIRSFGQDPGAILAGLGIGGLAVSFAARDAISPFLSGISLYATRPFRMGDFLHLDDQTEGIVEEIGLRATLVRKRDGTLLTIPNNQLTASVLQNRTVNRRTHEEIPIPLDIETSPADRDEAIRRFLAAASAIEGLHDAKVVFRSYGEESIGLILTYWFSDAARLNEVRTRLLLQIDSELRELGVRLGSRGWPGILNSPRDRPAPEL